MRPAKKIANCKDDHIQLLLETIFRPGLSQREANGKQRHGQVFQQNCRRDNNLCHHVIPELLTRFGRNALDTAILKRTVFRNHGIR